MAPVGEKPRPKVSLFLPRCVQASERRGFAARRGGAEEGLALSSRKNDDPTPAPAGAARCRGVTKCSQASRAGECLHIDNLELALAVSVAVSPEAEEPAVGRPEG